MNGNFLRQLDLIKLADQYNVDWFSPGAGSKLRGAIKKKLISNANNNPELINWIIRNTKYIDFFKHDELINSFYKYKKEVKTRTKFQKIASKFNIDWFSPASGSRLRNAILNRFRTLAGSNPKLNHWIDNNLKNFSFSDYNKLIFKFNKYRTSLLKVASSFSKLKTKIKNKFIGNPFVPFKLNIQSLSVPGSKLKWNFDNYYHFRTFINKQISNEDFNNIDSSNVQTVNELGNNVFSDFKFKVTEFKGGCNKKKGGINDTKIIKTNYFEFNVHNPPSQRNNCGIVALSLIPGIVLPKNNKNSIDYNGIRNEFNLKANAKITVDDLYKIYHLYKQDDDVKLNIISDDYKGSILPNINYIILFRNHFYLIKDYDVKVFKNKRTKRGYLFWDIESRIKSPDDYYVINSTDANGKKTERKAYVLCDAILAIYYKPYKQENFSSLIFRTDENSTSSTKFLKWLTEETNNGRSYHCVAHNASRFDNFFLINQFADCELASTDLQIRGSSVIGMQYKNHLFKDSCCFLTFPLDFLCNAYKVKDSKITEFDLHGKKYTNKNLCFYRPELDLKQFMTLQNTDHDFWNLYEKYCLFDCISLSQIWFEFIHSINALVEKMGSYYLKNCKVESCNTIGSHAKKLLIATNQFKNNDKKYMKLYKKFYKDDTQKKYEFINKFKVGGISHCNKPGLHLEGVCSYDITSQYPASQMKMRIPVGYSKFVYHYDKNYKGLYHLKNLTFDSKYQFKPIAQKINGILRWNNDFIDECYTDTYMIHYLKKYYGLTSFDVVEGLVSNHDMPGKYLFSKYVLTFFTEKMNQDKLKSSNDSKYNSAMRETVKLYLNSLTGKLVEEPCRYYSLKFNGFIDSSKDDPLNHLKLKDEIERNKRVQDLNIALKKKEKLKNKINKWKQKLESDINNKSPNYVNGIKEGTYRDKAHYIELEMKHPIELLQKINNEIKQLSNVPEPSYKTMNNVAYQKELQLNINQLNLAGIMIYSYSKRLLFEYIRCLPNNSNDVIHVETDSIYFPSIFKDKFIQKVSNYKNSEYSVKIGNQLGNVKLEKFIATGNETYFLGKKFYYMGDNCMKIRGIPLKTIDEHGNDVPLVNYQLYKDVFNWKEGNEKIVKEFYTMKKVLFGKTYIASTKMHRTIKPNMEYKIYDLEDGNIIEKCT